MSKLLVIAAALSALAAAPALASADEPAEEPLDRNTAFLLSLGGTAASATMVVIGGSSSNGTLFAVGLVSSLVTPAAGEIYAGKLFTWGMGIRVVSAGAAVVGFAEAFKCLFAEDTCHSDTEAAGTLIAAGAIGYAGGVLYDIATAGSAVDDYNRRYHLRVTPTVIPTTSSGPAVGVGVAGSF
jgi:hypothetical protein